MAEIIKQNQKAIRYQPDGPGTAWKIFRLGESGVTGRTNPGPGKTPTYITDRFGKPIVGFSSIDPPGGIPSFTLEFYDTKEVSYVEKQRSLGCDIYFQIATVECGTLDNPALWDAIDHYGKGLVGDIGDGDGPVTSYSGTAVPSTAPINFDYKFRIVRTLLSALTTTEAEDLHDIVMLGDAICNDCGNGYPGADKIGYISAAGGTAAAPNILYTINSGGTWAATSAAPFVAAENASELEWQWIDTNQFRLLAGCGTSDGAQGARVSYADVTLGAEATTVWTEVEVTGTGVANGDFVTALAWLFYDRVYLGTDQGEIFHSDDQGETFANAALFSGANQINAFAKNHAGDVVWAVGASNAILRELNQSGTFAARTGPSGGGAFTAIAIANDNTLYAGNGTSIFKSINDAENTGGWTELKDFGSNKSVVHIAFRGGEASRGGDSQCIWAVVDDTTGAAAGGVWESIDGGNTWRQLTNLANLGYNAAYFSSVDNNWGIVVGDTDAGSKGAIHLVSS